MNKIWLVARREFLFNVRRKEFLFAAIGLPLLMIALMFIIGGVVIDAEMNIERLGQIGYVDEAGILTPPQDLPETFQAYPDENSANEALNAEAIGAYFIVPADYMDTGDVRIYSTGGIPEALEDKIDYFLIANLARDLEASTVARVQEPVDAQIHTLDNDRTLSETAIVGVIFLPFLLVFVQMFASQITSGYLMSGISEEKTNRIIEVLVTSIRPFELLMGKMLGLGAVGLVQLGIWIICSLLALQFGQGLEILSGVTLPLDIVVVALVYFFLGYTFYASIMAALGAIMSSEQESRQWAGLFGIAFSVPFFFVGQFIEDINGTIPVALTMIPFTAPSTVLLRIGFGNVPAWQLGLSILIMVGSTILTLWIAARVFRWALLMTGKTPNLKQIIAAVMRGPRMETSAAERQASL